MNAFNNRASLSQLLRDAPFTFTMIIINVTVFVLEFIFGFIGFSFFQEGALYGPFVVEYGEWYRIITSAFLHGGFIHLLSNTAIGLYFLTAGLERLIGTKKTVVIYIAGMLLASGLTLAFNFDTPTIGASGAIFGAIGGLLYITIYRHDLLNPRERQFILQLLAINIIFTLVMPGISITGHLGGLVGGYLISYLLIRRNNKAGSDDVWDFTH